VEPAAHFRRRAQRPGVVIAFVEGYLNESWLDLKYFGVPLKSSAFVLGQIVPYTQWDPDREHVRPRPHVNNGHGRWKVVAGDVIAA
jgi:hypothetical protein